MASTEGGWTPAPGEVLSVSDLLARTRALLEQTFSWVWVEGEIANARIPGSGHAYFSLGDDRAQVKAVCFRPTLRLLGLVPKDGVHVLARGRLTLYEARGDVQLVVEDLEPLGEGSLRLELEARKRRLAAEGLFDLERKRPLPGFPRGVGVVTSGTGAALQDILKVLRRRAPGVAVLVVPTPVQGRGAPKEIAEALSLAASEPGVDVVILGRGGGSAEDLSAFNDEDVVRAVARCPVPVVSAVGHETDVPLVDFAADVRAPTPSAAAELAVREWGHWAERTERAAERLRSAVEGRMLRLRRTLDGLEKRLRSPQGRLDRQRIAVDRKLERLGELQRLRLRRGRAALAALDRRLAALGPTARVQVFRSRLIRAEDRLSAAVQGALASRRGHLGGLFAKLEALGPRAVLSRGYAIVRTPGAGVIRDAGACREGQEVEVTLALGRLDCVVRAAHPQAIERSE